MVREDAGAGRQADEITRPRKRPGDSMNEPAQRKTPHVGIFWGVQTSNGEARLLAAGCPLDQAEPYGDCLTYGPGHYETWAHWERGVVPSLPGPARRGAGSCSRSLWGRWRSWAWR